jgi:ubiquinone biosynthesis protein COQ9
MPAIGDDAGMDEIDPLKSRILHAALRHVPFDGWSRRALARGAADAGLSEQDAIRAFPQGGLDAVLAHSAEADRAMAAAVAEADGALGTTARIALGIRHRLETHAEHKEAIRRGLGLLALPQNAPAALKALHRTVDALWRAAGDTATDFNWYTKRAMLAAVYAATLQFWLNDSSEGGKATWAFLDRRLADIGKLNGAMARLRERMAGLPDPLQLLERLRAGGAGPRRRRRGRL